MARKKQEIQLQAEVETQEEWEEMLAKEGLTVVDIYQEWCGSCKAMVSVFRRIKNELGDDLLHFSIAKADTVDALEKYRGKCKPCFLFFAGGVLVKVIRGADTPVIHVAITEQLAQEHKVLDGQAERKEVRDTELGATDDRDRSGDDDYDEEDSEEEAEIMGKVSQHAIADISPNLTQKFSKVENQMKKGVTVAIIKPDLVQAGKTEEIIEKMKEHGIEILEQSERTLTEEEARDFYSHKQEEEFFEDLVKFMSSGPSVLLVLTKGDTGEGIIEEWRELLGPASVEQAKEQAPDSLRAQYGTENYINALHGSDSSETSMRELAFFFPNFVAPTIPGSGAQAQTSEPKIQRTLALIRPDAMAERKDEILEKIKEAGFSVAMMKEIQLSKEQAEEFYQEHKEEAYFEELTNRMSGGPLLALALARDDAVTGWRELLGPKELDKAKEEAPESFRAQFSVEGVEINQLHGSDSDTTAQKEIQYFFGDVEQTLAVVKPDAYQTKEEIMQKIKEAGFHIAARKETEVTKEIAQSFYKEHADKEYYEDLTEHMTSGPTLFMVLSREDAVDGWRSLIGPTDPEKAKEEAPESLRAQFGQDIKANALHGSSDPAHAKENINLVFGDLNFNEDAEGTEQKSEEDQQRAAAGDGENTEEAKGEEQKAEEPAVEGGEQSTEQPENDEAKTEGPASEEAATEEAKPEESAEEAKPEESAEEAKPEESAEEAKPEESAEEAKPEESAEEAKSEETPADDGKTEEPAAGEEGDKAAEEQKEEQPAAEEGEAKETEKEETAAEEEQKKE